MTNSPQDKNISLLLLLLAQVDRPSSKMIQSHAVTHDVQPNNARLLLAYMLSYEFVNTPLSLDVIDLPEEMGANGSDLISSLFDKYPAFHVISSEAIIDQVLSRVDYLDVSIDFLKNTFRVDRVSSDTAAAILLAKKEKIQYQVNARFSKNLPNPYWFKHLVKIYNAFFTPTLSVENVTLAVAISMTEGGAMIHLDEGIFVFSARYEKTANSLVDKMEGGDWRRVGGTLIEASKLVLNQTQELLEEGMVESSVETMDLEVSDEYLSVLDALSKRMSAA